MTSIFQNVFALFVSWWGVCLLAALDSSMLFFLPFGVDAIVIYLAARNPDVFWAYPLLAAAGSIAGAAGTFWIGTRLSEVGLERIVSRRRLDRFRNQITDAGAVALAFPALMPPPFPLTPFILACGALKVDRRHFFVTFGLVRLLRFVTEATLARVYGRAILRVLRSESFQLVVAAFIIVALAGTTASAVVLWKKSRHPPP